MRMDRIKRPDVYGGMMTVGSDIRALLEVVKKKRAEGARGQDRRDKQRIISPATEELA